MWENGDPASQISNTLAAAVGRQEAYVDVKVEGHARHVQPIAANYDGTTFTL